MFYVYLLLGVGGTLILIGAFLLFALGCPPIELDTY